MNLATNHFAHNLNLQVCIARVIGLILVILFLRHYLCWALTGIPLVYPVVTLCCGDIAVFGLQDKSLHVLPQIIMGVDVGSRAWVVSGMVNPPALPWHHKCELSIVAGLVHLCSNEQGTGLVLFHTFRVGYPTWTIRVISTVLPRQGAGKRSPKCCYWCWARTVLLPV